MCWWMRRSVSGAGYSAASCAGLRGEQRRGQDRSIHEHQWPPTIQPTDTNPKVEVGEHSVACRVELSVWGDAGVSRSEYRSGFVPRRPRRRLADCEGRVMRYYLMRFGEVGIN